MTSNMDEYPRQKLVELVAQYGVSFCDDPERCGGLLRDHCAEYRKEINVLVTALNERVTAELLHASATVPIQTLLARLSARLQDQQMLTEEAARWAVESWALALGKITQAELATTGVIERKRAIPSPPPSRATSPPPVVETQAPAQVVTNPAPLGRGKGNATFWFVFFPLALFAASSAAWWFGVEEPRQKELAELKLRAEEVERQHSETEAQRQKELAEAKAAEAERKRLVAEAEKKRMEAEAEAEREKLPKTLVVPDQYQKIQEAIDKARTGDTIKIKAGYYNEKITLNKEGLQIIGEGKDAVRVRSTSNGAVLLCQNVKKGIVCGITFQHTDGTANDERYPGINIFHSNVEIAECQVCYADGNGIAVYNGAPRIINCLFQNNRWCGIRVAGSDSQAVLESNRCNENGNNGIYFCDGGKGQILNNYCENNKWAGISLFDPGTEATLTGNRCRRNEKHGVAVDQGAKGELLNNICDDNKWMGISVSGVGAKAILTGNQCQRNASHGICYQKGAGGEASNNVCNDNKWTGILMFGAGTKVNLMSNRCSGNERFGISFDSGAGGKATSNVCENNKWSGMAVAKTQANPSISNNRLSNNTQWGLIVDKTASPPISNNQFFGNERGDVNRNGNFN